MFDTPGDGGSPGTSTTTTTGIVVIAVVCCVVGTSLVWVVIIYQTRNKRRAQSTGSNPASMAPCSEQSSRSDGSPPGIDINSSFTSEYSRDCWIIC